MLELQPSRKHLGALSIAFGIICSFATIGCGGDTAATGPQVPLIAGSAAPTVAIGGSSGQTLAPIATGGTGASTPIGTAPAPTAGAAAPTASGSADFCSALGVFRNKCQTCHGTDRMYGAPMSLVTYDDLQKPAATDATKKVYQMVSMRIHDANRP
ncbi:MAG TPA: hypothetical protein VGI70_09310, partial [Polyangiales bacterium]